VTKNDKDAWLVDAFNSAQRTTHDLAVLISKNPGLMKKLHIDNSMDTGSNWIQVDIWSARESLFRARFKQPKLKKGK